MMNKSIRAFSLHAAGAAVAMLLTLPSTAQERKLPPPEQTDPVTLAIMKGFPPPQEKIVTLGNLLKYPNSRWGFQHIRELGPTAAVWRGKVAVSPLPDAARQIGNIGFQDNGGQQVSIDDWQKNTYTDGLLVLHKGQIVYQKYYSGMRPETPHALWSLSKSFTGLLSRILIQENKLDPNARVSEYLPELADTAWGNATVQQTLDMTTSAQYREVFTDPKSEIFQYLFAGGILPAPKDYAGPKTTYDFLKTVKKDSEHGNGFKYKSVDTEVMGWVLSRITGKSFAELVSDRIWSQIGAEEDAYVWVDPAGTALSSIGLNATLRDLGRLGEALRMGGRINGRQAIPQAVVAELRKGGDREKFKANGQSVRTGYSYHDFWWNPHDADGSFEAKGLNGQHIHINPAAELVIVKLSSHPVGDTGFTHDLDRRAFAAIAKAVGQ
ncbi:MAG TPA: serine hydrolase [Noviherbaspirillum sp.]|nr:serine hydrolase [Noviherbaspirillum sp.]